MKRNLFAVIPEERNPEDLRLRCGLAWDEISKTEEWDEFKKRPVHNTWVMVTLGGSFVTREQISRWYGDWLHAKGIMRGKFN